MGCDHDELLQLVTIKNVVIASIVTDIYNMSHHVIQLNNQVRNLVSSCNCNVFNKHLQDISCNDNISFQSNNHFNYNILNSRLQYLDFTIAIAANQYLQSPLWVQSAPRADDRNSSSGSASRRWVGCEHGGTRVTHEDRGHEACEREPHRDPDRGTAAHHLESMKRRTGSGKRMTDPRSDLQSAPRADDPCGGGGLLLAAEVLAAWGSPCGATTGGAGGGLANTATDGAGG
jgi:hypothetical protein